MTSSRSTAVDVVRRLVGTLGGRYSIEMGIDVDRGDDEVERWFLAATLFGTRISAQIVERTYGVLVRAGVRTIGDAGARTWDELVALLDEGGYARYDFRTATRLRALAQVVNERYGGRISTLGRVGRTAGEVEAGLDALPGWGPVTVRLFLRELRGVWASAEPEVDERAAWATGHLLLRPGGGETLDHLRAVAYEAGVDVRDLEAALVRLALAHARRPEDCPGGAGCRLLEASGQVRAGE